MAPIGEVEPNKDKITGGILPASPSPGRMDLLNPSQARIHHQPFAFARTQRSAHRLREKMASVTMTASFLGGVSVADRPSSANHRRNLAVTRAAAKAQSQEMAKPRAGCDGRDDEGSSRRAAMLAVAAAAVCAVGTSTQGLAIAGEEPKRGTPEAKKLYAPVCVTMPTAKICYK